MTNIFDGIFVVDLTTNLAGPSAASMLADFGAEVIKIEKPGGDDSRRWMPFIEEASVTSMWINRGKKSLVLDLTKTEGMEIIRGLISKADVVLESFRPGIMKKMGLGYDDLVKIKPDIIMCSVSGLGQTGPASQKPGYDIIAQALSGLMSMTGFTDGPPVKVGTAVGDWTCGLNTFGAISAALYHRERTGEGQFIDISLLECLINVNEYTEPAFNGCGSPIRGGNHQVYLAPYGVFKGKDGYIIIATVSEKLWKLFCKAMNKEELCSDPMYCTSGNRASNQKALIAIIEEWLQTFDTVNEVQELLEGLGVPCAKVNRMTDLTNDPHLLAREMIVDMETSAISAGKVKARGVAIKYSKTPGKIKATPALGEHNEVILRDIMGYDPERIAEVKAAGVLG